MSNPSVISDKNSQIRRSRSNTNLADNRTKLNGINRLLPIPWELWPAEGRLLLTLIAFWSIAGLFVMGSASWWVANREMGDGAYYIKRQLIWLLASWSLFYLVITTKLSRLLKLGGIGSIIGCILVGATLFFGNNVNGATRWLIIGPLQIQPSELIKPFVILQAANLFSYWKRIKPDQKIFWISIFIALLFLILKQPNLSTAGLIGIIIWLIALAAGVKFSRLIGTAFAGLGLGLASILINDYQRLRIVSFINPWQDPQGNGYQLVQSLLAIGSGGWFGEGYGLSTQKLQYLPIQSTDFIYAVFAEEFGFAGSFLVLTFLMLIAFLSLRVALKGKNNQAKLIAIGSSTILVVQAILNMAVASGLMPTTGLPFPMVSYGGNSLLSSLFLAGLLIRCSLESTDILIGFKPSTPPPLT